MLKKLSIEHYKGFYDEQSLEFVSVITLTYTDDNPKIILTTGQLILRT